MDGDDAPQRRGERFIGARRERFFEMLRETGNARTAAAAIGMDRTTLERRRRKESDLDREWTAALDEADRRLGTAGSAHEAGDAFEMVRRGRDGRLQIVAVGKGRWCRRTEDAFFAHLKRTGNASAAARAVGFSGQYTWQRRRQWPAFARRWEEALEEAEIALEFRLAVLASDVVAEPGADEAEADAAPIDPEFALKFLKWREEKRAGRGRRGRGDIAPRQPTIEEVKKSILQKIESIERQRKGQS